MNRKITIATAPVDGGGFVASVVEDSWSDDSEENPYLSYGEPGGSGLLGWSMHEGDREETAREAFVVMRANLRFIARDGDVYEFTHSEG